MITGNFALLAGVDPDAVDRWYLGIYIDAIEWVEITNTRGMSQFADGGIVGTKPYIASANYIGKMSNYCSGCAYNAKQRTGQDSCPFNSLYWHFLWRNRDKLGGNPRLALPYANWDGQAAAQQILRRRGLEQSPASTGINAGHKSKLLTPSGLVDEAITLPREKGQMLATATRRFERA
jgi:deoxyribodipyrimidine photolyase-like uncharacterized protein